MKEILEDLALYIKQKEEKRIQGYKIERSELTLIINHQDLIALLTFLRQDIQCEFVSLIDIAGVDYPHRVKRFDLVYHFLSPRQNQRIRIKVPIEEDELVPSLTAIYPGAIWFEREAYDLYGILFSGHPDLRRLLTDYGFEGHPLRKDFPVTGFVEVRYDDEARRVVYDPVELRQEFRNFDSMSPWEGINHAIGSSQGVDKNEKNVS